MKYIYSKKIFFLIFTQKKEVKWREISLFYYFFNKMDYFRVEMIKKIINPMVKVINSMRLTLSTENFLMKYLSKAIKTSKNTIGRSKIKALDIINR